MVELEKSKYIYVMTDEQGYVMGWGSHRSSEGEIEVEIDVESPFFTDMPFSYKVIDGILIKQDEYVMNIAKQEKDEELNLKCKEAIVAGFEHVVNGQLYWFSYDMEAQGNFRDGREVLKDGLLSELQWTVRIGGKDGEYGRIMVDLPIIQELSIVAMMHKTGQISKYRDFLMPLVNGAQTVKEVEEVVW